MSTVSDNLYDDLDITLCPSGGFCDKDYFDLAMLSSSFENVCLVIFLFYWQETDIS